MDFYICFVVINSRRTWHYYDGCGHFFFLFDVDPKQQMRIQGWVSQRPSGSEEIRVALAFQQHKHEMGVKVEFVVYIES